MPHKCRAHAAFVQGISAFCKAVQLLCIAAYYTDGHAIPSAGTCNVMLPCNLGFTASRHASASPGQLADLEQALKEGPSCGEGKVLCWRLALCCTQGVCAQDPADMSRPQLWRLPQSLQAAGDASQPDRTGQAFSRGGQDIFTVSAAELAGWPQTRDLRKKPISGLA